MNKQAWKIGLAGLLAILIVSIPTAAMLRADNSARPMMSHDFTDVPVAGQEFMEPYINEFYHRGITGGCSTSPLQYCPSNPVTRGSMAVFVGRALGYVEMTTDGVDARAYFKSTSSKGAVASSTNNIGFQGESINHAGVYGTSQFWTGMTGYSDNYVGVMGTSLNGNGLMAVGEIGSESLYNQTFDVVLGGELGDVFSYGVLNLVSNSSVWIDLDQDDNSINAFAIWNGADTSIFSVDEAGNTFATGSKSAIVDTVHYGTRAMYAVEATEVLFEDVGRGQLVDGEIVIELDPIFAETVNLDEDYEVFLTPIGDWADLYVAEMTATSFTVRAADGISDIQFSYRIVATRLGFENVRMEEVGTGEGSDPASDITIERDSDTN